MHRVYAPFSFDQVESLNAYQRTRAFHPFTCVNRGDHNHIWRDGDQDLGVLDATTGGWICSQCDYLQHWAHEFMADWSWRGAYVAYDLSRDSKFES